MLYEINQDALAYEMEHLGVYPPSVAIMLNKGKIVPLKVLQVRTPAANIIKQEMLAVGGECATPGTTIACSVPFVDILLLGTRKHYNLLLKKLKQMPYFGIPKIVPELECYLQPVPKSTLLADGRRLTYEQMAVMGIINVTPDSFFAGSRRPGLDAALQQAETMLADGAAILDIGGESTRPGSDPVGQEEEMRRVLPVVEAIKKRFPASMISVDTYRAAVAEAAMQCGGDIINDVTAMTGDDAMLGTVLKTKAPIVLMHMRGKPKDMQQQCEYTNVVQEVTSYLLAQAQLLRAEGVAPEKIILDPGIGFAKKTEQNLRLMQNLNALTANEYPVLMAASRKTTIGQVLSAGQQPLPPEERLEGTLAVTAAALYAGAAMVRVHDVKENLRLIRMLEAIRNV